MRKRQRNGGHPSLRDTFPLSPNMESKNFNDRTRGSLFYHLKPDINDVNANFRRGENNMNRFGLERYVYLNILFDLSLNKDGRNLTRTYLYFICRLKSFNMADDCIMKI
jgi:hypothetical protein